MYILTLETRSRVISCGSLSNTCPDLSKFSFQIFNFQTFQSNHRGISVIGIVGMESPSTLVLFLLSHQTSVRVICLSWYPDLQNDLVQSTSFSLLDGTMPRKD